MSRRLIDGAGAGAAIVGIVACLVVGAAFGPGGSSVGRSNVAILHLVIVIVVAAVGGRGAGLITALFAALNYNWFFTSPFHTLRVDTPQQVITVLLLFAAGTVASFTGRASRQAVQAAHEESGALTVLNRVARAAAAHRDADREAVEGLSAILGARAVQVWRAGPGGDHLSAAAGSARPAEPSGPPSGPPSGLVPLDDEGRIPPGHQRVVGGRLVLPAGGVAVELHQGGRRVGALVVVPEPDQRVERATRAAVAAVAHILAAYPAGPDGERSPGNGAGRGA